MDEGFDEGELWRRLRRDDDGAARQALFSRYAPWSRVVAREVWRRVPATQAEWADFVNNAAVGLLEAIGRFDAARGLEFKAYAKPRVRGAVFNGLRAFLKGGGEASGGHRPMVERLESIGFDDEGDPLEQMTRAVTELGIGFLLESRDGAGEVGSWCTASAWAEKSQLWDRLIAFFDCLTDREQAVLSLHYFQHVSFVHVAEELGISKGRVSQIHRAALEKLRRGLNLDVAADNEQSSSGSARY